MTKAELIAYINANIYENETGAITATSLNSVLQYLAAYAEGGRTMAMTTAMAGGSTPLTIEQTRELTEATSVTLDGDTYKECYPDAVTREFLASQRNCEGIYKLFANEDVLNEQGEVVGNTLEVVCVFRSAGKLYPKHMSITNN